jgi:hypothetical protein
VEWTRACTNRVQDDTVVALFLDSESHLAHVEAVAPDLAAPLASAKVVALAEHRSTVISDSKAQVAYLSNANPVADRPVGDASTGQEDLAAIVAVAIIATVSSYPHLELGSASIVDPHGAAVVAPASTLDARSVGELPNESHTAAGVNSLCLTPTVVAFQLEALRSVISGIGRSLKDVLNSELVESENVVSPSVVGTTNLVSEDGAATIVNPNAVPVVSPGSPFDAGFVGEPADQSNRSIMVDAPVDAVAIALNGDLLCLENGQRRDSGCKNNTDHSNASI